MFYSFSVQHFSTFIQKKSELIFWCQFLCLFSLNCTFQGDMRALEDLTYKKRKDFITKHKLPLEVPLISFHSEASIGPGVMASMTHIAHAEIPWLPLKGNEAEESNFCIQSRRQVPVLMPVSADMAICALHLQLRYGEKAMA